MKFRANGFTLLEVLMAVVILGSGVLLVVNSWSANYMQLRKSRQYNTVSSLLEQKMAELEVLYRGVPLDDIPDELSGNFDSIKDFSWKFESQEFNMPDMSAALVAQDGGASDQLVTIMKQMAKFMSDSIKEAKLTVISTKQGRSVEYSLTTYFVDYNQDIGALGGDN